MPEFPWILVVLAVLAATVSGLAWQGKKYNSTDWGHPFLNILDGLNVWFCRSFHRLDSATIALPASGPCILLSNHISGLDPMLLLAATDRPLRFMIAQEEFERWWLKWLLKRMGCIPVKRDRIPRKVLSNSLAALEQDQVLVVFPQGGIVPDGETRPLKRGAFLLASLSGAPVCAVRIEDVRGQGYTLLAVAMRSSVRIIQHKGLVYFDNENTEESVSRMSQFLVPVTKMGGEGRSPAVRQSQEE